MYSGFHELDIQCDGHLVADENATGLECRVPGQAEVFAVDLGRRRDRDSDIAPWILLRRRWPFNRERDLAGNAPDCQVAFDLQFYSTGNFYVAGFERQLGKLLDVQ